MEGWKWGFLIDLNTGLWIAGEWWMSGESDDEAEDKHHLRSLKQKWQHSWNVLKKIGISVKIYN